MMKITAAGTLTKNAARHDQCSVSAPEISGPRKRAVAQTIASAPKILGTRREKQLGNERY